MDRVLKRRLAIRQKGRPGASCSDEHQQERLICQRVVRALSTEQASRRFDLLFVNAGIKNDDRETIADVSTDERVRMMWPTP
jgi:hypothetical protein